jgi:hypothetical protein
LTAEQTLQVLENALLAELLGIKRIGYVTILEQQKCLRRNVLLYTRHPYSHDNEF